MLPKKDKKEAGKPKKQAAAMTSDTGRRSSSDGYFNKKCKK